MKKPVKEAIALEYGQHQVPSVVLKADAELAERVITEARRQGIMVTEDAELLSALANVGLHEEIPPELYHAVAVLLSWVYWLKGLTPEDAPTPPG
jgi:flagellar biosynthesis protein